MEDLEELICKNRIIIFSKSSCPFSREVTNLFDSLRLEYKDIQLDRIEDNGVKMQQTLFEKTGQKCLPSTFVNGWHIGGSRYTLKCANNGTLQQMLDGTYEGFEYDLMVIGMGPGGNMAAFEAARLDMKVAICDYTVRTSHGTRLNAVCNPNRLIQRAGVIGTHINDAPRFGWNAVENISHNWEELITSIQKHVDDLNAMCLDTLVDLSVRYFNGVPEFESVNTVKITDSEGRVRVVKAREFIIAASLSPEVSDIPGSSYGITPDDVFSLPHHPGNVLVVGCSESGVECAGNLAACDVEVTLLARSHALEGYDQQMVDKLIEDMVSLGVKFHKDGDLESIKVVSQGTPGKCVVTIGMGDDASFVEDFNTVVFAVGCLPKLQQLGVANVGVKCDNDTGHIIVDEEDRTTVDNIFAVGSACKGKQLESLASRTAKLLVHRLHGTQINKVDIVGVAHAVFSSLDYGFVGMSEEAALQKYGELNVEVYHSIFKPLEYRFSTRFQKCYLKLVCVKSENERVVGLHMTSPFAGNIVQGFALAMKLGACKSDFNMVIGIHPTTAEEFTGKLQTTKASGEQVEQTEC